MLTGTGCLALDSAIDEFMPRAFSNLWYHDAMAAAIRYQLSDDLVVRLVTAPYFVAAKLEAFKGRGNDDFFSHDLEAY